MNFLVCLLGFKAGEKVGNKAYGIVEVLVKGVLLLTSFFSWGTYVEILRDIIAQGNVGQILLTVILTIALVLFFCFSVYQIETKRAYYSRKFTVVCVVVMAAVLSMHFYLEFGELNALCLLYIFIIWITVWLPKKILRRLEESGKKSALIGEIERQIQKRKNRK